MLTLLRALGVRGAGENNGKQAKSEEAEANDEEESVALVSDMPDTNFEIKFLKKENEIEFVIPEGSSIHEVLCEEAYRMNKVLPKHKLDSFTQLREQFQIVGRIKKS